MYGDDDYQRIIALGIPAFNANTGKECHLDAHLVEHAIEHLPLDEIDILFIENVGNMVCPTDFRLGAEKRVVIVSSTEGDDVVNKHPMMFRDSTIGVINKVDLAPFVGANLDRMEKDIHRYNPGHAGVPDEPKNRGRYRGTARYHPCIISRFGDPGQSA